MRGFNPDDASFNTRQSDLTADPAAMPGLLRDADAIQPI